MHYGLHSYSLIERLTSGSASSRVQGKHSHLPPRECPRASAPGRSTSSLGEKPWNRIRYQTTRHMNLRAICSGEPMPLPNSSSARAVVGGKSTIWQRLRICQCFASARCCAHGVLCSCDGLQARRVACAHPNRMLRRLAWSTK